MKKLSQYFASWKDKADVFLEACWFYICFHYGRRGREGWTSMTKDTFTVKTNDEDIAYVCMTHTEVTKNHQGGHKQHDIDYSDQRMYGPGVEIYKHLMSKLHPKTNRLFQNPLNCYSPDAAIWFKNEPMGKNTLSTIMKRISTKAGLSQQYTCHSVRASTVTTLFQAGVTPQSIIAITKHKNTSSLGHYIEDISVPQKRQYSSILSDALAVPEKEEVSHFSLYVIIFILSYLYLIKE